MSIDQAVPRESIAYAYESERPDVLELVPPNARRVLDLGCASGALGAALKRRQPAEVVGVELEPAYAADAAVRLDRVLIADLEQLFADRAQVQQLGSFDCLIAADVLEHLRDPWRVLREASRLLAPGGTAVVSLPNVRHWETFWSLGRWGVWPLRDVGIFDRTHLRFFALANAVDLLEQAGLQPGRITRNYRLRSERDSRYDRRLSKLERTPLGNFFVFQYVIEARPR